MSQNDDILETLRSIECLLKILVRTQLGPILEKELSDETKKKVYLATGIDKVSELSKKLNRSTGWISGVWKNWERMGLIVKEGKTYRKIP
jgi:predicted transcriptional regulator